MNLLGKTAGFLVGLLLVAIYCGFEAATGEPVARREEDPTPPTTIGALPSANRFPKALGVAGCAGQACHGNGERSIGPLHLAELADAGTDDSWQSSYFRWHNLDRHARAWETLKNPRSQNIEHRLTDGKSRDATADSRCLACHANPTLATRDDAAAQKLHRDGVGCESCHGNAEKWRDQHVEWQPKAPRDRLYADVQMTELHDLGVRAETCVGCHVGAPASGDFPLRDVNHDLIAAGHPRLNFELTTYLRMMPPHWKEKDRALAGHPARLPGYEAQVWLVGQAACAEASLNLLASRAQTTRWPELAEFNCASCHHQLRPAGLGRPSTGSLLWNSPLLMEPAPGDNQILQAARATAEVRDLMLRGKPAAVGEAARSAAAAWGEMRREFAAAPPNDATIQSALGLLRLQALDPPDWDQAARLYYGLVAIENAKRHLRGAGAEAADPRVEIRLENLHRLLRTRRESEPFEWERVREELRKWSK